MHDVLLEAHAVPAPYRSGIGLSAGSGTSESTHVIHHFHTAQAHSHDRSDHHGVFHPLKKRLTGKVGVVLAQYLVVELHHLQSTNLQALLFENADYLPNQATLQRNNKNYVVKVIRKHGTPKLFLKKKCFNPCYFNIFLSNFALEINRIINRGRHTTDLVT